MKSPVVFIYIKNNQFLIKKTSKWLIHIQGGINQIVVGLDQYF